MPRARLSSFVAACALAAAACSATVDGTMPDAATGPFAFVSEWGHLGSADGEFHFPIGIAIDAADILYVTDFRNARIQRFDVDGTFLSAFATDPYPGAIAIDRGTGELFVTHFATFSIGDPVYQDKIAVYAVTGAKLREWGHTGAADGELAWPGGIAIGADKRIYVGDQQNHRVQIFDAQGVFLGKWGMYGPALGQFGMPGTQGSRVAGPNFLAIDNAGDIYTTEGSVGRVQRFTADGQSILGFGSKDDAPGQFGGGGGLGPLGITTDSRGKLWVSALSGRVQQFTNDGTYVQGFGSAGMLAGEFNVAHGLALDSHGALYIVDGLNHRVQKFSTTR